MSPIGVKTSGPGASLDHPPFNRCNLLRRITTTVSRPARTPRPVHPSGGYGAMSTPLERSA
eukprot:4689303-Prymnesium_polylepis.1